MSRRRRPNGLGQGNQISIDFNVADPTEARALEVARRLAMPHGRRKHLLVAVLNAIGDLENALGREVSADMIAGALLFAGLTGRAADGFQVPPPPPSLGETEILVGAARKATAEEQGKRFKAGLSGLF